MELPQQARRAADRIAEQLRAPPPARVPAPTLTGDGAAGVALLHIERAIADGDWAPAHHWLAAAASHGLDASAGCGLYHGAPAFAFALDPAGHPGYAAARAVADRGVQAITRSKLEKARHRLSSGQRPAVTEYDLISGLAGLGAHLRRHDPAGDLINDVLAYLVRLTDPLDGLPGWWTPTPPRTGRDPPARRLQRPRARPRHHRRPRAPQPHPARRPDRSRPPRGHRGDLRLARHLAAGPQRASLVA